MAQMDPAEFRLIVECFVEVGTPSYAPIAILVDKRRRERGNSKHITRVTLERAWEIGYSAAMPPISSMFPDYAKTGRLVDPVWPDSSPRSLVSNQIETSERSESSEPTPVAPEAGIASAALGPSEGGPVNATSQETHTTALAPTDPTTLALQRLDAGRIHALANEVSNLVLTRKNLIGVQGLIDNVIAKLGEHSARILEKLVGDMATGDAMSIKTYRETLREVVEIMKASALTFKLTQEAQRLLIGMPQRIEERRGGTEESADDASLGRLSRLLSRTHSAQPYGGEDAKANSNVQDATFVDVQAKTVGVPAEERAKTTSDPAKPTKSKG